MSTQTANPNRPTRSLFRPQARKTNFGCLRRHRDRRLNWYLLVLVISSISAMPHALAQSSSGWKVVGWNNLGMHCMDADFSVFSILPPYNTIHAQVIDPTGNLVTDPTGLSLTYEAVADPSGSINRTSVGKGNFWEFVHPLFGVQLAPDVGLPVPGPAGFAMPGVNNVPQAMVFDSNADWFAAYGIPITPLDDAMQKNTYPMMRLTLRQGTTVLTRTDIVLPVSDEMDCRACHASGSNPAAEPKNGGWVNLTESQRDYRLNILRRHDQMTLGTPAFQNALSVAGYSSLGLYDTVVNPANPRPILCAACHVSEALPNSGQDGISSLTAAMHSSHASVVDPSNGLTLETTANRASCYRCHPGSATKCLRGVMGRAVASDGSMAMQCQSCHGSMSVVGAPTRTGWLDEPNCQACHTGTATRNNGQIRYESVFDAPGHYRAAVDQTFATTVNTPAQGFSLFRFSRGHGGLYCEACHGSTHAEFGTTERNDNITSVQHQGHAGMLVECTACHASTPATVSGGPHGMHPVGQSWVSGHHDAISSSTIAQCQTCHGKDYRGTVLSRARADRTFNTEMGTKVFWQGFQIGCYTCHNGPTSENTNPNHAAVVTDASATTLPNTPVAVSLTATDADGNALTLRIVSQSAHGTVGLAGATATYFPDTGYVGSDSFTFAAWDGSTDSNLGTVRLTVGSGGGCIYSAAPTTVSFTADGGSGSIAVTTAAGCVWQSSTATPWITISSDPTPTGSGSVSYTVAPNPNPSPRTGTLTVAEQPVSIAQAAAPCTYGIAPTEASVAADGAARSVNVTAGEGCAWEAGSGSPWITITSGSTGSGNGTVYFIVVSNPDPTPRTGTLTVAGQIVSVAQAAAACSYSISPATVSFSSGSSSGTVAVSAGAGCAWTTQANVDWITIVSDDRGSGPGTVTYRVQRNRNRGARTGTLTIAGLTFTVTQAGRSTVQFGVLDR
jgi:hypothetical protein